MYCPKCLRSLIYIKSVASIPGGELDTHFYSCPVHGAWKVLPTGRIEPYSFKKLDRQQIGREVLDGPSEIGVKSKSPEQRDG